MKRVWHVVAFVLKPNAHDPDITNVPRDDRDNIRLAHPSIAPSHAGETCAAKNEYCSYFRSAATEQTLQNTKERWCTIARDQPPLLCIRRSQHRPLYDYGPFSGTILISGNRKKWPYRSLSHFLGQNPGYGYSHSPNFHLTRVLTSKRQN